jgi:ankyrin repeat protein
MAPTTSTARSLPRAGVLRWGLALSVLGVVAVALRWSFLAAPPTTPPDQTALAAALRTAIRDGDHAQVSRLLEQGARVEARDEASEAPLMQAALQADAAMMRLFLDRDANVQARTQDGTSALLRAVHNPDKVRLLLQHGALPESRAVVLAAMVPGSRKTLELLLQHGGDSQANVGGFTALMAAAFSGDLESVTCLLDHGADVRARTPAGYTAVYAAVASGNIAILRLLLDRGATPNTTFVMPNSGEDIMTPTLFASWKGDSTALKELLARGADVHVQGGPFQRTALLCAATNGNPEVVRLLLERGAEVQTEDWAGHTALDWARRRGETPIVKLLQQAGAHGRKPRLVSGGSHAPGVSTGGLTPPPRRPPKQAVEAGLSLLERSTRTFAERTNCIACHHQALLALAVGQARQQGLTVEETSTAQEAQHIQTLLGVGTPRFLLGAGIDPLLAAYALVGLAAEKVEPNRLTDALVHYLVLRQKTDGHWRAEACRPPDDASDFMFTALSVYGLYRYAAKGRAAEINRRIALARNWLVHAEAEETVDQVFRLLGLRWAGAGDELIQAAARRLLSEQHADGGWAQLPTLESDAYATGQVLFALREGGRLSVADPVYRRGVEFLLRTQLEDGSWFVSSRCFPLLESSQSGFPHGRSQFISAAATGWAILALIPVCGTNPPEVAGPL